MLQIALRNLIAIQGKTCPHDLMSYGVGVALTHGGVIMYVALITLIALISVGTLYFWQLTNFWSRSTPAEEFDTEHWNYKPVDGPGWYIITGELARE